MSITVLNYHDQTLVDQVNTLAAERAEATRATEAASQSVSGDFSSVLSDATYSYSSAKVLDSITECPTDLYNIFEEAANTYGVSVNLLTSIARAESNFRTDAVSSAGAVGIMQLMPTTAASLGVTNSYDARENIMGGAKYISQLLSKYNGNTALALAAYNAGSGNVEKYGGIPPFTETQNYVQKVLSYYKTEHRTDVKEALAKLLATDTPSESSIHAFVDLLNTVKQEQAVADTPFTVATTQTDGTSTDSAQADTSSTTDSGQSDSTLTVTVINE